MIKVKEKQGTEIWTACSRGVTMKTGWKDAMPGRETNDEGCSQKKRGGPTGVKA